MTVESETRNCPHCKEEIKLEAVKCKHCGSWVAAERPSHEGTCPYCKEQINQEAIKCKHCGSNLRVESPSQRGCGCKQQDFAERLATGLGTPASPVMRYLVPAIIDDPGRQRTCFCTIQCSCV